MASRNLTEIFILMRNNAMQNRNLYMDQNITDRMALMESGLELKHRGSGNGPSTSTYHFEARTSPMWTDALEETQYALVRLETKLKELGKLQETHLLRPTLDESTEQETKIELLTQEISRMFNGSHRLIQQIKSQSSDARSSRDKRLVHNVISSLVTNLQQKSMQFRSMQSSYLNKIKTREERSKLYFDDDTSHFQTSQSDNLVNMWEDTDLIDRQFETSRPGVSQTQTQLLMIEEDNAAQAKIRAQEVDHIVKSIVDLNHLFKDLSHMIVHQGTILDRIDYNVEKTEYDVKQGYQQLAKADRYHRKNRKMACILCLATTTLVLLILLILMKF